MHIKYMINYVQYKLEFNLYKSSVSIDSKNIYINR